MAVRMGIQVSVQWKGRWRDRWGSRGCDGAPWPTTPWQEGTRPGPRHGSTLHDRLCLHQDAEEFKSWAVTMAMAVEKASSRELLLTQPFFRKRAIRFSRYFLIPKPQPSPPWKSIITRLWEGGQSKRGKFRWAKKVSAAPVSPHHYECHYRCSR